MHVQGLQGQAECPCVDRIGPTASAMQRSQKASGRAGQSIQICINDLSDPAFAFRLYAGFSGCRVSSVGHMKFENAANDDGGAKMIFALESYVTEGFGPIDKETAGGAIRLANDPMALAILADHEDRRP
jgi:hypothetical protein